MPANTPNLSLPYPIPADSVDVPRDIQALATSLDTLLGAGGSTFNAAPVLDVGMLGQIRAGRQLAVADFTAMGLGTPVGLFNLGSTTNLGSGGALTNKGTVPFGVGVNGLASTAAQFAGSTAQALYIADTGASDPFRIKTGSFGCWLRTAKRVAEGWVLTKWLATGNQRSYALTIGPSSTVVAYISGDGTASPSATGVSDVGDDRWHFVVSTYDGTALRLYVDGVLEATTATAGTIFGGSGALNIGTFGADAALAGTNPHYGRVDEAFVTPDVLSEDQIRNLYCIKALHGLTGTPTKTSLRVRRQLRGGPLVVGDFPASPIRLHNFTGGALTDAGTGGITLTNNGTAVAVSGADGTKDGAFNFNGTTQSLSATDAGLPATTATRCYGFWFKTTMTGTGMVLAWASSGAAIYVQAGSLVCASGGDNIAGPYVADGQWHFAVATEDNAAGDGVRRKLYLDGRLASGSTVLNSLTLGGANNFRIGANSAGANFFTGQIDGAFVTGTALTFEQQAALYAKGTQALAASPKNAGDHVEALDSTSVLATFDTLDSTAQIDLKVEA